MDGEVYLYNGTPVDLFARNLEFIGLLILGDKQFHRALLGQDP